MSMAKPIYKCFCNTPTMGKSESELARYRANGSSGLGHCWRR